MATLLVLLLGCLVGALGEDHQLGMISSPPPPYHDIRTTVEPSQSTKWPIVEPETEQPAIIENVTDRSDNSSSEPEKRPDNYFDLLIFTQHWPYTTCLDWEEKRHGSCSEIGNPTWSVHGLWPTQFHRIAPSFCNSSWPFDVAVLDDIRGDMDTYWPDIEIRDAPNSLWDHEWSKHGTCAVGQVDGVTSEKEYFRTGCRLAKENPVSDWLTKAGISPSDNKRQPLSAVWNAVLAGAGTRPHIDCEKIDGQVYIKEVKVCFNKKLERVDCDGIKSSRSKRRPKMMGTCARWGEFIYPSSAVPPSEEDFAIDDDEVDISTMTLVGSIIGGVVSVGAAVALLVGCCLYQKSRRERSGYQSL